MKRKVLVAVLAATMAVGMVGCGKDQGKNEETSSSEKSVLKDGEMSELVVTFPSITSSQSQIEKVEKKLNEIIAPKIDATVKIQQVEWGTMQDQYNLMLSSGDDVDLMFSIAQASNYQSRGQITPLDDLLKEYAPTVYEENKQYWPALTIEDEIYGIPTFCDHYNNVGLVCRTDILEEMGVEPESKITQEELNDLLARVKEKYPDMYMLTMADDAGTICKYYPYVMDAASLESGAGVIEKEDGTLEAVNMYATDEYREMAEQAYEWQQKGYIVPDVNTTEAWGDFSVDEGNVFGYLASVKPGYNVEKAIGHDHEMSQLYVKESRMGTGNVKAFQWVIPTNSDTPEKAMAFFEMMYTTPEIMNLFCYGIEGEDYEILDAEKGIAGYGETVTADTDGWKAECYMMGNSKIAHVWDGNPENYWELLEESNNEAIVSPIFGFVFDTANVRNEITAIANVIQKYVPIIENGLAEPDSTLKSMNEELEDAGIQNIVDEMQKQVDAWAEKNK